MKFVKKGFVLSLLLTALFSFSLFLTQPVYADTGSPTAEPAQILEVDEPEENQPVISEESEVINPVETPVVNAPIIVEVQPTTKPEDPIDPIAQESETESESSDPNEELTEDPMESPSSNVQDSLESTDPESISDLADLPVALAELDVQLVNEQEEALPMVSESTVGAVSTADPYFMVGTVKYSFTHADCDPDTAGNQPCTNPIQATLDYIRNRGIVPTNRMIYVEDTVYTEDVVLDGTTSSPLSQIKGLIGQSTTGTILNGNLQVSGTVSGFLLSNFTVNGQIYFDANKGPLTITDVTQKGSFYSGIVAVAQNGPVNLTRVNATNNGNSGAYIDNTISTGSVTITESTFDGNGTAAGDEDYFAGLEVYNRATVTLNGVSASGNNGDGAVIDGFKTLTVRNSLFNDNDHNPDLVHSGYGLDAHTSQAGTITLDTVVANNNDDDGIRLLTYGNAALKYVTAEDNGWNGLRICGLTELGGNDCTQARAVNVSVINSSFSSNGESGITIADRGTASITEVFAGDNGLDGIRIQSIGNVTFNCVSAQNNTTGVYIDTSIVGGKGSVSILNTRGTNNFSDNMQGLEIRARGAISLAGVDVGGNDQWGAILDNTYGTSGVTLKSTYFFDNDWFGAEIWSNGAVSVQGGAISNGQDLSDLPIDSHGGGLYINNYTAAKALPVTLTFSWFNDNLGGDGLFVDSRGNISLTDVYASNNSQIGVNLHNAGIGTGTILVKGSQYAERRDMTNNGSFGLYAISNNSITVLNMNFINNGMYGALLDNSDGVKKAISLTNVDFYGNGGDGLDVFASGAVTITNINSAGNTGDGVYIDNQNGVGTVTIARTEKKWHNYLSDNGLSGLKIFANGAVSLYKVMANNNGWNADPSEYAYGAFIENCRAVDVAGVLTCTVAGGTVSIKGTSDVIAAFNNNKSSGLVVYSPNTISLSYVEASENGQYGDFGAGIYVVNNYAGRTAGINLSHITAYENNGSGLTGWTNGAITATYIESNSNAGIGASLNNVGGLKPAPVTVKYINTSYNTNDGVSIHASGAIVVFKIDSYNNAGNGAILYNWNAVSAQAVTLSEGYFNDNSNGDGLSIISRGAVKLANVTANNNDITDGYLGVSTTYGGSVQEIIKDYDNAGNMVDYWTFSMSDNTNFTLWLQSYDFVPVLTLYQYNDLLSDWEVVALNSDDSDGDNIASFTYSLLAGVQYRVSVSSPGADQTGMYVLDIGYDGSVPYTDNSNGANGVYINTDSAATINNPANATSYNNNSSTGLYIFSGSTITLTNVFANENGNIGASLYVMNNPGGITINGWSNGFYNNRNRGLDAYAGGVISLTNLDASGNGSDGAALYNYRGVADVKILSTRSTWANSFSDNNGDGLSIGTRGNVTLAGIRANNNAGLGTEIYNYDGYGPLVVKTAKVSNSTFNNNANFGLYVQNYGPITVDLVTANDNTGFGISLDNTSHVLGQTITVTRATTNYNSMTGLFVISNGKIILDGLCVMGNGGVGAYFSNQQLGSVGTIVLTNKKGTNFIFGNAGDGLTIYSNKAITISGIETKQNTGMGIRLNSMGGVISLTNAIVNTNGEHGIYVESTGFDVILNAVRSYMNGLDNGAVGIYAGVTGAYLRLTNSSFYGNGTHGVYADLDSPTRLLLSGTTCFANGRYSTASNYYISG